MLQRGLGRTRQWRVPARGAVVALAGAAVIALVVAPAGAAATRSKASRRIVRAANQAARQSTFRFDGRVSIETRGELHHIDFSGAVDVAGDSTDMTYDLSDLGAGAPGPVRMLAIGHTLYVPASLFQGRVPADALDGKKWVSADTASTGGSSLDDSLDQSDPSGTLDALRGVSDDVQTVGTETIDGVPTTHYRGDIDLSKAVDRAPARQKPEARDELAKYGVDTATMEVWIDAQNLPRRVVMSFEEPKQAGNPAAFFTTDVDYIDFGAAVHVVAPPRNQVVTLADLQHASNST